MEHDIKLYIIDNVTHGRNVVEVTEDCHNKFAYWGHWMADNVRRIAHDVAANDVEVSTMFLGVDQWPCVDDIPKTFETRVWKGGVWIDVTRSETWDKALEAHKNAVHCKWIKGVDYYEDEETK